MAYYANDFFWAFLDHFTEDQSDSCGGCLHFSVDLDSPTFNSGVADLMFYRSMLWWRGS